MIEAELASLRENIKELEKLMIERIKSIPGYENLLSVKGIGPKSAAIFLANIPDIKNFDDTGRLASYFRITPAARKDWFGILASVAEHDDPKMITSKNGNCVLISQREWDSIQETNYLMPNLKIRRDILEGIDNSAFRVRTYRTMT